MSTNKSLPNNSVEVVVRTPPGRGAVATLHVTGVGAAAIVDRCFHAAGGRPLEAYGLGGIIVGRWDRVDGEEIVVCRLADDRVAIHCHGGQAAVAAIVKRLAREGVREAAWRDWLPAHEADPLRAAAHIALARARTARAAAILLDQYEGALRDELVRIVERVEKKDFATAAPAIDVLLERAPLGLHLTEPFRVVLAGRPNVGKSSLINALVGYQRAIVYDAPGTTRDAVTAATAFDGWPVELTDTAGLHESDDSLELAGMRQARRRLDMADLVVLVFDLGAAWNQFDDELLALRPDALVVHNKLDLADAGRRSDRPRGLAVSALRGEGISELVGLVAGRLAPLALPVGAAVPFTEQQVDALKNAQAAIARGAGEQAIDCLRGLLERRSASPPGDEC